MKKLFATLLVIVMALTACGPEVVTERGKGDLSKNHTLGSAAADKAGQIGDAQKGNPMFEVEVELPDKVPGSEGKIDGDFDFGFEVEVIQTFDENDVIDRLVEWIDAGDTYVCAYTEDNERPYYVSVEVADGDFVFFDAFAESMFTIREGMEGCDIIAAFTIYEEENVFYDCAIMCNIGGMSFINDDDVNVLQYLYTCYKPGDDRVWILTIETRSDNDEMEMESMTVFGSLTGTLVKSIME